MTYNERSLVSNKRIRKRSRRADIIGINKNYFQAAPIGLNRLTKGISEGLSVAHWGPKWLTEDQIDSLGFKKANKSSV